MDKVVVSPDGYCFLAGVLNTADYCPIRKISVYDDDWALLGATPNVARCRPTKKENQFGNLAGSGQSFRSIGRWTGMLTRC